MDVWMYMHVCLCYFQLGRTEGQVLFKQIILVKLFLSKEEQLKENSDKCTICTPGRFPEQGLHDSWNGGHQTDNDARPPYVVVDLYTRQSLSILSRCSLSSHVYTGLCSTQTTALTLDPAQQLLFEYHLSKESLVYCAYLYSGCKVLHSKRLL